MVENQVHKHYPRHYSLFLHAVRVYGRESVLDAEEAGSTVYKHIQSFRDSQHRHQQARAYDSLVLLLFPELKDAVTLLQRISYDRFAAF
jgi:demethoxyubiquinone hydroxylase (CLK1/Coq7/Cat5 family)